MLKREWPVKLHLEVGGEKICFHVRDPEIGDIVSSYQAGKEKTGGDGIDTAEIQISFALGIITDVEGVGYKAPGGVLGKAKWKPLNNKVDGWKDVLRETCPDILVAIAGKYQDFLKAKEVQGDELFFAESGPTSQDK
jgi:hypothetical protein